MSAPENVLAGYDDKSKEGKLVIQRVKTLANRYKRTGINKENICGIVSTPHDGSQQYQDPQWTRQKGTRN